MTEVMDCHDVPGLWVLANQALCNQLHLGLVTHLGDGGPERADNDNVI